MAMIETKQHLNLSEGAKAVLDDDRLNWSEEKEIPYSTMIATIFQNYYEDATASISARCAQYRDKLVGILDEKTNAAEIEKLLDAYRDELLEKVNDFLAQKGEGEKINVCNGLSEIFLESEDIRYYNFKRGKYLKAVLEEYATLPMGRREEIYFKEWIEIINRALRMKCQLRVSIASGEYFVKPYKVMKDELGNHNYLVGFSCKIYEDGTYGEERPVSLRISRLRKVKCYASRSGVLFEKDRKHIEEEIERRTVQFMTTQAEEIIVKLTPRGEENFKKLVIHRPRGAVRIPEMSTPEYAYYRIECTDFQAQIYFSKFWQDALIVSPARLRDRMRELYRTTYLAYEENADKQD